MVPVQTLARNPTMQTIRKGSKVVVQRGETAKVATVATSMPVDVGGEWVRRVYFYDDDPCFIESVRAVDKMAAPELMAALLNAWYFIENVSDDDPDLSEKFFALREQVYNILDKASK
jgi:hypothetical protein